MVRMQLSYFTRIFLAVRPLLLYQGQGYVRFEVKCQGYNLQKNGCYGGTGVSQTQNDGCKLFYGSYCKNTTCLCLDGSNVGHWQKMNMNSRNWLHGNSDLSTVGQL